MTILDLRLLKPNPLAPAYLDEVLYTIRNTDFAKIYPEFKHGRLTVGELTMDKWVGELEAIKRSYCAQFIHEGCGGAPEAYVGILIGCTVCDETWDGSGWLGKAIERTKAFKSLVWVTTI